MTNIVQRLCVFIMRGKCCFDANEKHEQYLIILPLGKGLRHKIIE